MSPIILFFAVFQVAFGCRGYHHQCGFSCGGHPHANLGHGSHIGQHQLHHPSHPKPMPIPVSQPPVQYIPTSPQLECYRPGPICDDQNSFLPPTLTSGCFSDTVPFCQPSKPTILSAPPQPSVGAPDYISDRYSDKIIPGDALPVQIVEPSHSHHSSPIPSPCDLNSHCPHNTQVDCPSAHPPSHNDCGPLCAKHYLVKCIRPVYDEYIRNVPVIQNVVRQEAVTTVKSIPAIKRKITMKPEPYGCHNGPICPQVNYCKPRPVSHKMTRVIPVRTVMVPVSDRELKHCVPHPQHRLCVKLKPVVQDTIVQIPVQQKSYRPVVEQRIVYVPVKTQVRKNLVEHRVHKTCGPCECIYN